MEATVGAAPASEWMTMREFIERYRVGKSTAYDAAKAGRLRVVATGARFGYRVSREEAERFMSEGCR